LYISANDRCVLFFRMWHSMVGTDFFVELHVEPPMLARHRRTVVATDTIECFLLPLFSFHSLQTLAPFACLFVDLNHILYCWSIEKSISFLVFTSNNATIMNTALHELQMNVRVELLELGRRCCRASTKPLWTRHSYIKYFFTWKRCSWHSSVSQKPSRLRSFSRDEQQLSKLLVAAAITLHLF
jgi:hypothetical protein